MLGLGWLYCLGRWWDFKSVQLNFIYHIHLTSRKHHATKQNINWRMFQIELLKTGGVLKGLYAVLEMQFKLRIFKYLQYWLGNNTNSYMCVYIHMYTYKQSKPVWNCAVFWDRFVYFKLFIIKQREFIYLVCWRGINKLVREDLSLRTKFFSLKLHITPLNRHSLFCYKHANIHSYSQFLPVVSGVGFGLWHWIGTEVVEVHFTFHSHCHSYISTY